MKQKLRAAATAFLIGSAAMVAAGALTATPAQAAAIRAAVGKPLQDAQEAMKAGNCTAAMAAVRKAEGAGNLSADEQKIIAQMKNYIASASKGACGADTKVGVEAKFYADWRARRYREVINAAGDLRRHGLYTAGRQENIAAAYYYLRDYAGCLRFTQGSGSAGVLEVRMRCAYDGHNDAVYRETLENLVASTNKGEFWSRLIKNAEAAKALSDRQSLDIYRIKFLTGGMGKEDYNVMTLFALQLGFAAEAKTVIDAGIKAGVVKGSRAQRLTKRVQDDYASNQRNLPRVEKEAKAAKKGDLLVKLGEDYCGMGRGKDAVAAIEAGIAKGVADQDFAQIRLGQAYYLAGQKREALAALKKVKDKGNNGLVATLWELYIKTH